MEEPPASATKNAVRRGLSILGAIVAAHVVGFVFTAGLTIVAFPFLIITYNTGNGGWGIVWILAAIVGAATGGVACPIGVFTGRAMGRRRGQSRRGLLLGGAIAIFMATLSTLILAYVVTRPDFFS